MPGPGSEKADFALPLRKRRRPALSCVECRRRKIKCDRNDPCNHCKQSPGVSCVYSKNIHPASGNRRQSAPNLLTPSATFQNLETPETISVSATTPNQNGNTFLAESCPQRAGVSEEGAYSETECCGSTALPTVHDSLFGRKAASPQDSNEKGEKRLPDASLNRSHDTGICFSTFNDMIIHDGDGKAKLRTKIHHQSGVKMYFYGQSHWKLSLSLVNGNYFWNR